MVCLRSPCNLKSIAHTPRDFISCFSPGRQRATLDGMRAGEAEKKGVEKGD